MFVFVIRSAPHVLTRYEKTGTPFPKELREYVEQMKSKSKVEPEEVVVPSTGAPPPKPGADAESCQHQSSYGLCDYVLCGSGNLC